MTETLIQTPFPWLPHSAQRGAFAIAAVQDALIGALQRERGVHAPTLLSALGAVAGVAAQRAMWHDSPRGPQDVPVFTPEETPEGDLYLVRAEGVNGLFAGELLDSYLAVTRNYRQPLPLWGFLGGALLHLGVPVSEHPVVADIFARVNARTGTAQFGITGEVGEDFQPGGPAYVLAKRFWPLAVEAFRREPEAAEARAEPLLQESHYLAAAAAAAQQLIIRLRDMVPPVTAAVIIMEAAICACRLEPRYIDG